MFNELADSLQIIINGISHNYLFVLSVIGILWGILLVNRLMRGLFCLLGVYPRRLFGLIGIIFSPFIHYHYEHLLFNCLPLFLLMNFILLNGYRLFYTVSIGIILIAGGLTWLFGRRAIHYGASHVIMGYFGYLLCSAFVSFSILTLGLAGIAVYYFGGALLSIFPVEDRVSWESHLFGLIAGVIMCFLLSNYYLVI